MALDASGNLYICDSANNTIRRVSNGVIAPYLGDYIPGFTGDTTGTISMDNPTDIFFDSAWNLWIADYGNGRIREYGTNGICATVVGGGQTYTEGGFPLATVLAGPHSVVVDASGNIYIADADDNRMRVVNAAQTTITTLAGTGPYGFSGDGGLGNAAEVNTPNAVAVDLSGNVYFVDLFNYRVRMVAKGGTITTAAGNGAFHYAGDGGAAQTAQMSGPSAVAASPPRASTSPIPITSASARSTPRGLFRPSRETGPSDSPGTAAPRPARKSRFPKPWPRTLPAISTSPIPVISACARS